MFPTHTAMLLSFGRILPLLPVLALTGCVSLPPASIQQGTQRENLIAHVAFLAQPSLKGRKPRTSGSRHAREYISARFKAWGLVPWGQEQHFEQSFGYGQNIVGVLPGTDPSLSKEIVLVCAHYDHLGKNGTGKIHPGAADNAAGVAALLETARHLAQPEHRPKRSVAFAAFDCEEWMLFGSFVFSLRKDVQDARIVAVLNADILGRQLMEVVPHTIFVAGTENYPQIRARLKQSGSEAGLRVLPLGTDLVGPRSDHVAFESRGVPCLFFSSGTCKDYHQPTDTAEKLNYRDLENSASVILAAAKEFGNCAQLPIAGNGRVAIDTEELQTITTVMSDVNANREAAGVKKEDAEAFTKLAQHAESLLQSGQYNQETRAGLISEATGILAPYFLPLNPTGKGFSDSQQKEFSIGLRGLHQFYSLHRLEVLDAYSKLVAEVLKRRPGPFRSMPVFDQYLYKFDDRDISFQEDPSGACSLRAFAFGFGLRAGSTTTKWLFHSFGVSMSLGFYPFDCDGTRQQLIDFCLLRLRYQQSNAVYSTQTRKVLAAITGATSRDSYKDLLADRLRSGGFNDETEWIVSCILSDSAELALAALEARDVSPRVRDAACKVILNHNTRGDVRAAALRLVARDPNQTVLFTLCDVLGDSTPVSRREYTPHLRPGYPFATRPLFQTVQPFLETQSRQSLTSAKTIGTLARAHLKRVAKKDYGADAARWRKWAETRAA